MPIAALTTRTNRVVQRCPFCSRSPWPESAVDEAADLLRTTKRAIYAMIERQQLPGVIRVRRWVLLRADDLLNLVDQKRAPSPEE